MKSYATFEFSQLLLYLLVWPYCAYAGYREEKTTLHTLNSCGEKQNLFHTYFCATGVLLLLCVTTLVTMNFQIGFSWLSVIFIAVLVVSYILAGILYFLILITPIFNYDEREEYH